MEGIKLELGKDETVKFPFGGKHAVVVTILRLVDESNPQKVTLICDGTCEQQVDDSIEAAFHRSSAGVPLDVTERSFFKNVLSGLLDYMQKTVLTLRWRCSMVDGPTSTFKNGQRLRRKRNTAAADTVCNPLTDIHNTADIRYVVKNGELFDGNTLDEVWPKHPLLSPVWFWDENPELVRGDHKCWKVDQTEILFLTFFPRSRADLRGRFRKC